MVMQNPGSSLNILGQHTYFPSCWTWLPPSGPAIRLYVLTADKRVRCYVSVYLLLTSMLTKPAGGKMHFRTAGKPALGLTVLT